MSTRPRVVIASPHKIEREMLADWLSGEGMEPVCVSSALSALHGVSSRLYELLVADAGFAFVDGLYAASRGRAQMPAIVVGNGGSADEARADRHGAMFIPRPVERDTFLSFVSLALVDGRTPRRSPRKPVAKSPVTVDGVKSFLIDVSNEGLRVEIPAGKVSPAPFFVVHVPVLNIALSVQRVWVSNALRAASGSAAWCGVTLVQNSYRAEQLWRGFVASVPVA